MANPDFAGILNRQSGEVERPKPLPIGQYVWKLKGMPEFDKSNVKGTPYAEFTCIPIQALDTVDPDALEEALTRKSGKKQLSDMVQKLTFYLTDDSLFRLKEFAINDLQVATEEEVADKSLAALIEMMPNGTFIGTIKHVPSKDGKGVYANIGDTAPVEG